MRSHYFGSAGKIGNLRAQSDFLQQNRRSPKSKTEAWSTDLGFSPHFRIERSFSALDAPISSEDVLKTVLIVALDLH